MFYTREQFESILVRDLLENPRRWISGNGPGLKYVAHEITDVSGQDDRIVIEYTMREGVHGFKRTPGQSVIYINFLDGKPYAVVELLEPPDAYILVLKPEFEPATNNTR